MDTIKSALKLRGVMGLPLLVLCIHIWKLTVSQTRPSLVCLYHMQQTQQKVRDGGKFKGKRASFTGIKVTWLKRK